LNLFVKIDLQKWLDKPFEEDVGLPEVQLQGVLFWKIKKWVRLPEKS